MKVEILNPETVQNLYKNHGEFACVCYDTQTDKAENVGKSCEANGHMSGSRCEYIKFRITDVDRGTAEQIMRHEIGTWSPYEQQDNYSFADYAELVEDVNPGHIVKNMASFRYIDKDGFSYATPKTIAGNPEAKKRYDTTMSLINFSLGTIKKALVEAGVDPKQASQDANFLLPRATTTDLVVGFTPEALIHFCHKRMCSRAQEYIREVAGMMKAEVAKYNPEFAEELKPHCEHLLWCPEGRNSCGRKPTKAKLKELLEHKE